jgi:hypothetical protein
MDAMGAGETGPDDPELTDDMGAADEPDSEADADIEAALDTSGPLEDRIVAFRKAVQSCMKGY